MKIAYVHVLPLEYYPPARNTISLLSRHNAWSVRAWTTANRRGLTEWTSKTAELRRPKDAPPDSILPFRLAGFTAWHVRTAMELASWKADVVLSVEPHSTPAVWLYYNVFRGSAPLFVHHHEYYAPEDYDADGMRILRATRRLQSDLLQRAAWVSETNERRLALLRECNATISDAAAHTWPNYPPESWVRQAQAIPREVVPGKLRTVYVGSASLEDTFIAQIAAWVARNPETTSLHVVGENIGGDVWNYLRSLNAKNISLNPAGCDYEKLPSLLRGFDVGLVLYKGNTLNFVHNVPNKAIEYLTAGLEVWYPREMEAMQSFHARNTLLPMREMNFASLPERPPASLSANPTCDAFDFTNEKATAPLIAALERLDHPAVR